LSSGSTEKGESVRKDRDSISDGTGEPASSPLLTVVSLRDKGMGQSSESEARFAQEPPVARHSNSVETASSTTEEGGPAIVLDAEATLKRAVARRLAMRQALKHLLVLLLPSWLSLLLYLLWWMLRT